MLAQSFVNRASAIRANRSGRGDRHAESGGRSIAVMAAGVNFNNVWAARGQPIDVIAQRQRAGGKEDFHVGGSDASGIVYELGEGVTGVKVGDHVIVHPGYWDANEPWIKAGKDPMIAGSARIWGYDAEITTAHSRFSRRAPGVARPTTSRGRRPPPRRWWEPPRIECCSAGQATPSRPTM
jgi:hypothetical protein